MAVAPPGTKPWVLITGASSGIGEAFARRFAREGWNVVLLARSHDQLENLAHSLESRTGAKSFVMPQNLTNPETPQKVYEEVKRKGIELEGLINNAGIGFGGRFW